MTSNDALKSWCEDTYDDFPTTGLKPSKPSSMKKNEIINNSDKNRAKTVQFKNVTTGELISRTFYGSSLEISNQIDDYLNANPDYEFKQQFTGLITGGLIVIGIIFFGIKFLL